MLRLTTNVTVSPASSRAQLVGRRSHLLDHLGPALGEQRGQLLRRQRQPVARPRDRARRDVVGDRHLGAPARAAARDERPVAALDHVEHRLRDPLRVDVLRVHAQPLGQREPVRAQPLADLRRRRERVLGRDVVAVRAQPAEVGRAGARPAPATSPTGSAGPGCRRPGISRRASRDQPLHVLDRHRRRPTPARRSCGPSDDPGAPVLAGRRVGDLRRLAPVVALVRDEVLEDHLLDVAVALVQLRELPRAPRPAPPRSRRSRRGSRW